MKIYVCTEVLKDGAYSRELEADSWAEAEAECAHHGWHLEGELDSLIDANSGAVVYSHDDSIREVLALLAAANGEGES